MARYEAKNAKLEVECYRCGGDGLRPMYFRGVKVGEMHCEPCRGTGRETVSTHFDGAEFNEEKYQKYLGDGENKKKGEGGTQ